MRPKCMAKPKIWLGLASGALFLMSAPVFAQFRADAPPVLDAPPAAIDPRIGMRQAFARVYQAAGSPRATIFWNKAYSDQVATRYEEALRMETQSLEKFSGREDESASDEGISRLTDNARHNRSVTSGTLGVREVRDERAAMAERSDWRLEQAFTSGLAATGVILIDRAAIVRAAGIGEQSATPNAQALEAAALRDGAEIVIEVLQTPDDAAPLGLSFRAVAKDVRSGRMLASIVTPAVPLAPPARWVAGQGGFTRSAPPRITIEAVGRQLADELLDALGASLN